MSKYIIRRIFIFIPTLFVITLLAFIINVNAPGDPVERMISTSQTGDLSAENANAKELHQFWRAKLGLDLPLFYFSLHSFATPDLLYKDYDAAEKKAAERLISQFGNWTEINNYFKSINEFEIVLNENSKNQNFNSEEFKQFRFEISSLKFEYEEPSIQFRFNAIEKNKFFNQYTLAFNAIKNNYAAIKLHATKWKTLIPVLSFYKNNQYQRWLFGDGVYSKGILRGDFGISYVTKQPVSKIIFEKIKWSLIFVILSMLIAYCISIPLGAKTGSSQNSLFDKSTSVVLFLLYSLPVFWIATLLIMTFSNPDVFLIFPASGISPVKGFADGISIFEKIKLTFPYLVLPLICYSYGTITFLSRTMRVSMIGEINKEYVRTARAKGLSETKVIYKHALRNTLLPAITLLANFFPLVISGAVVIETIFTIPGMGLETLTAVQNQNYPMITAILTITGFLTLTGYLVSDILYAVLDPRISFSKLNLKK